MLKHISIPELNFELGFKKSLSNLKKINKFDFFITIFWLIGPFIYLIERSTYFGLFSLMNYVSIISSSETIAHFLNDFLHGYPPVKSPNAGKNKLFFFISIAKQRKDNLSPLFFK